MIVRRNELMKWVFASCGNYVLGDNFGGGFCFWNFCFLSEEQPDGKPMTTATGQGGYNHRHMISEPQLLSLSFQCFLGFLCFLGLMCCLGLNTHHAGDHMCSLQGDSILKVAVWKLE